MRRNGRPKRCFWRVRFLSAPFRFALTTHENLKGAERNRTLQKHRFGRLFLRTTPSPLLWRTRKKRCYRTLARGTSEPQTGFYRTFCVEPPFLGYPFKIFPTCLLDFLDFALARSLVPCFSRAFSTSFPGIPEEVLLAFVNKARKRRSVHHEDTERVLKPHPPPFLVEPPLPFSRSGPPPF